MLFHLPGTRAQFLPLVVWVATVNAPCWVDRKRVLESACWVLLDNLVVAPLSPNQILVSFTREEEQASGFLTAL